MGNAAPNPHSLAYLGRDDELKALHDSGQTDCLKAKNGDGMTPLHFAAYEGHTSTVSLCLELGAEIDCQDFKGNTPLHLAAGNGHTETVAALVKARANLNVQNVDGCTALHRALEELDVPTALLLTQAGADPLIRSVEGVTCHELAARLSSPLLDQELKSEKAVSSEMREVV